MQVKFNTPTETSDNFPKPKLTATAFLNDAIQSKENLLESISHPQLKKLAENQLTELQTLKARNHQDRLAIVQARNEFSDDINALAILEERF